MISSPVCSDSDRSGLALSVHLISPSLPSNRWVELTRWLRMQLTWAGRAALESFHGLFSSLSCWLANGAFGFSFDFARTQSLFDSLTKLGTELESVGGFGNGRQGGRCLTFRWSHDPCLVPAPPPSPCVSLVWDTHCKQFWCDDFENAAARGYMLMAAVQEGGIPQIILTSIMSLTWSSNSRHCTRSKFILHVCCCHCFITSVSVYDQCFSACNSCNINQSQFFTAAFKNSQNMCFWCHSCDSDWPRVI